MKKMNILLVAFTLAFSALTPMASFATNDNNPDNSSQSTTQENKESGFVDNKTQTEISQTHKPHYTITIPDSTTELVNDKDFTLSATTFLNYGTGIKVSITSKNGWTLKDVLREDNKPLSYKMKATKNNNETVLTGENAEVYTFHNTNNASDSVTLTVYNITAATYAGTYKDVLTFTAETVEVTETDSTTQPTTN